MRYAIGTCAPPLRKEVQAAAVTDAVSMLFRVCAAWYRTLHWEDVLVGVLVADYAPPQPSAGVFPFIPVHYPLAVRMAQKIKLRSSHAMPAVSVPCPP
jgi:hypothetical protein